MTTVYDMASGEFITEQVVPSTQPEHQPVEYYDVQLRLQPLETTISQERYNFMHALPITMID